MWFKVSLRKDGAVISCDPVAESSLNGERNLFIEASSKEEAIQKAKADWTKWRDRKLIQAKARGLCEECFARPRKTGAIRCQICLTKRANKKRDSRARDRLPDDVRRGLEPARLDEIRLNRQISMEIGSAIGNGIRSSAADQRLDSRGLKPQAYTPSTLLRYVARAYDRDPEGFRDWLEQEIEKMTGIFARENRAANG